MDAAQSRNLLKLAARRLVIDESNEVLYPNSMMPKWALDDDAGHGNCG
jgi:hypothetical protein